MANYYVRSSAAGAGTGANWANAYTTLGAALAVATSTSIIYVADDHAETAGSAKAFTFPSTPGLKVFCVNTHATEPPTGLAKTASITTTGNFAISFVSGYAYIYGIIFNSGTGNSGSADMIFGSTNNAITGIQFEECTFTIPSTSANAPFNFGLNIASGGVGNKFEFINPIFKFGATGQSLAFGTGEFIFKGMTIDATGSIPTTLITPLGTAGNFTNIIIEASDLSGRAFTNLVSVATWYNSKLILRDCKLPSSITVTTGTFVYNGIEIRMHNCDSSGTNYRISRNTYQGSMINENTLIKSGGANDGTNGLSWKIVTSANALVSNPFTTEDIAIWNDVTTSITATIEILHDSATNLKDDEIWVEVEYLSSSGSPIGAKITDRLVELIDSGADQATSSVTWTTTGMTNPNKQKLNVTFTPGMKGYIIARVMVAKASYTVYIDPKITIT